MEKIVKIKEYINFAVIMVVLYICYNIIGFGCPVKFLTGISCAGCGMTRAWICVLHLDINGAFYYHPLFFLPPIYVCIFLFRYRISQKTFNWIIAIGILLFTTVYLFRLFNPDNTIVDINIENSFIYKLIRLFKYGGF